GYRADQFENGRLKKNAKPAYMEAFEVKSFEPTPSRNRRGNKRLRELQRRHPDLKFIAPRPMNRDLIINEMGGLERNLDMIHGLLSSNNKHVFGAIRKEIVDWMDTAGF